MRDEAFELELAARREQLVMAWEPPTKPMCSNCAHCLVSGTPEEPRVRCALGHGKPDMPLWVLIRPKAPQQFVPAERCPDFASMDDEPRGAA